MKPLQVLRPLAVIEAEIRAAEPHVDTYFNGLYEIHDGNRHTEAGFKSFTAYYKARFPESIATIKRALHSRNIRTHLLETGSRASLSQTPEIKKLVENTSEKAIIEIGKAPPEKRIYILKTANQGEPPTANDVKKTIAKITHKTITPPASKERDYSGAYSSAPKETPTTPPPKPPAQSSAQETSLQDISDKPSAIAYLNSLYERDRIPLNQLDQRNSPKTPRQIFDHIIQNLSQ